MTLFEKTEPDDSLKRSREIEDRLRNEQQKEVLLRELAKMRSGVQTADLCDMSKESVPERKKAPEHSKDFEELPRTGS
jgi:hypothetical protein